MAASGGGGAAARLTMGWMLEKKGSSATPETAQIYSAVDQRTELQQQVLSEDWGQSRSGKAPIVVSMVDSNGAAKSYGVVSCAQTAKQRASTTMRLFHGLCSLEGLKESRDYVHCPPKSEGEDAVELLLLTQEVFVALSCRVWVRRRLMEGVHALLPPMDDPVKDGHEARCPFDESGTLVLPLEEDEAIGQHYLQLLLGRGPTSQCPRACKYLQGIARDLAMKDLPYANEVLCGRGHCSAEDSVLDVLLRLDSSAGSVPVDFSEDLALVVATKALQLVEIMGLEL
mmetsp:Transcript_52350/g.125001  ORF Transcript_52350/g.125001 Transcript_52350/m.125001 type:complete len:285 (-) Transcript_52350:120-974(-)|eukprot:CAMPEP_0178397490 /NCGR_PEP_ID=MMETSP0689_2-20121128/14274_1 /TAXON_ID=160604 /ORGANISM="Amphidinium massartii, Strain CS-259" /LENGTH=284 /DNA_ID=CAMNT_0020018203 /DNA_START=23 /DNA_END=877 /DNA_ORIENTATION=-